MFGVSIVYYQRRPGGRCFSKFERERKVRAPRAGCWVTPSGGDSKESATEKIPPDQKLGKGEKVR